jgi:hypothetical protein
VNFHFSAKCSWCLPSSLTYIHVCFTTECITKWRLFDHWWVIPHQQCDELKSSNVSTLHPKRISAMSPTHGIHGGCGPVIKMPPPPPPPPQANTAIRIVLTQILHHMVINMLGGGGLCDTGNTLPEAHLPTGPAAVFQKHCVDCICQLHLQEE